MNLATDLLDIGTKVANVPGLSTAFALAIHIIQTVQLHKNNNSRLQYLAHFIANHLISIADCMQGRWDDAPAKLRVHLDEFEAALREVSKVVTKKSKSSLFAALINAGDRESDISRLERRLDDIQRSILQLVGLNTSIQVAQIHTLGRETHAAVLELVDNSRNSELKFGILRSGEIGPQIYTRDDLILGRQILCHHGDYHNGRYRLTVTLQEAKLRKDGRAVIARTYQGQTEYKEQAFTANIEGYTDHWHSSILQLIGTSGPKDAVPFEVYHLADQVETFGDWIGRTIEDNPAEAILGLYDMRISVKDAISFQQNNSIKFNRKLFRDSLVSGERRGDRLHWSLVYTGDLTSKVHKPDSSYKTFRSLRWDPLVLNSDNEPKRTLLASFSGGSRNWVEKARDLDAIIDISMDFPKLASALFENGYLGDCGGVAVPRSNLALGDVGYIDGDGLFVVVDNLHTRLISSNGQLPTWSEIKLGNTGGIMINKKTTVVSPSGKTYLKSEFPVVESKPTVDIGVEYNDLDQNHAWRLFQNSAREIIFRNKLTVAPHQLRLVYSIENFVYMTLQRLERTPSGDASAGVIQQAPEKDSTVSTSESSSPRAESTPPTAYIFENGDTVLVREGGAPELNGQLRPSLEAEPRWLDDEGWQLPTGKEQNDEVKMEFFKEHMLFYIQLPPGVAAPYITESNDEQVIS